MVPTTLPPDPLFVVLDGIDGCGKTTQAARLVAALDGARGRASGDGNCTLHLREPGSTIAGERIRALVLDPAVTLGRGTLAMLFAAARRETLEQLVAPALAAGRDVVVERFHASTFAYQGDRAKRHVAGERGDDHHADAPFEDEALLGLLTGWAGSPAPSVELVLDVEPEESFGRVLARDGGGADRFESRGIEFQRVVAESMRAYVERVPAGVLVDGKGTEDEVARRVLAAVAGGAAHG